MADIQELLARLLGQSPAKEVERRFPYPEQELPFVRPKFPREEAEMPEKTIKELLPQDEIAKLLAAQDEDEEALVRPEAGSPAAIVDERFQPIYDTFREQARAVKENPLGRHTRPIDWVDFSDMDPGARISGATQMYTGRVDPRGWRAFRDQAPESRNVEDRRGDTYMDKIRRQMTEEWVEEYEPVGIDYEEFDKPGAPGEDFLAELIRLSRQLQ